MDATFKNRYVIRIDASLVGTKEINKVLYIFLFMDGFGLQFPLIRSKCFLIVFTRPEKLTRKQICTSHSH